MDELKKRRLLYANYHEYNNPHQSFIYDLIVYAHLHPALSTLTDLNEQMISRQAKNLSTSTTFRLYKIPLNESHLGKPPRKR